MAFSLMIKGLLFTASLTILVANPSSAVRQNHLLAGQVLNTGESLRTGAYRLTMRYDCDLVLSDNYKPIWFSGSNLKGLRCHLSMQKDGNLVIYNDTNKPVWSSNTGIGKGNYILILQNDRNLALYGDRMWETGTNYDGLVDVVVAAARNGKVGVSREKQNKVREMGKIMEVVNGA